MQIKDAVYFLYFRKFCDSKKKKTPDIWYELFFKYKCTYENVYLI